VRKVFTAKTKGKTKMKHEELELQQTIVKQLRDWGMVVFSIPNERNCGISDAVRMRSAGLTKGAPDLVCWSRNGKCWWLELKTPKGRRSPEQMCMETLAKSLKIGYNVVRSVDDIKELEYWASPVL
jgi:hypothetical protein